MPGNKAENAATEDDVVPSIQNDDDDEAKEPNNQTSKNNKKNHHQQQHHRQQQQQQQQQHSKRGMKPRSKRNRKRALSELHSNPDDLKLQINIRPLELNNDNNNSKTPIPWTTGWLRTVEPYPYSFSSFAKARWVGRTILDVYTSEFGSYPPSYYDMAIRQGRILVSDQAVAPSYIIKGKDVLTHTVHRHEPGVAVYSNEAPFVKIVAETKDVLVVDKPGTLAVHPCGAYHVQSLMNLLEPQFGKLYTIHRLDRLTSGLVILGKTSLVAQEWGKSIMNRHCQKTYLARVAGKFPMNCPKQLSRFLPGQELPNHGDFEDETGPNQAPASADMARQKNAHGYWITNGKGKVMPEGGEEEDVDNVGVGLAQVFESQHDEDTWLDDEKTAGVDDKEMLWFHLACPTRIANPKDGICEVGAFDDLEDTVYLKTVKAAETWFGVVRYDPVSDSTLVICRPKTGRSHQIRLHLQYLGHSIANDPNYGGDIWYANPKGKQACQLAQQHLDEQNAANQSNANDDNNNNSTDLGKNNTPNNATGPATSELDVPATEEEVQRNVNNVSSGRQEKESIHDFIRRTCVWCARSRNGGTQRDMWEFLIRSPGIWLHALEYHFSFPEEEEAQQSKSSKGDMPTRFRAPLPAWCDFEQPG